MDYSKIISVTGLSGLFELVGSKNEGALVRSLEDKTTKFVSSRVHTFSHLESIEVFTVRDNVNLVDVLQAMTASSETLPNANDAAAVKAYFQKVYPDMDFDRVYASDMKKIVKWFSVLKSNDVEIKLREEEAEEPEEEITEEAVAETQTPEPAAKAEKVAAKAEVAEAEEAAAPKKKAKAAAKKSTADTEDTVATEEAPKKKAAAKKK